MGIKYEWRTAEVVTSTANSLKRATEQLTQVALDMQRHELKQALFPWTQHQWNCLDVVITMASQCQAVLPTQILARQQNRPSQFEVIQKKSKRDVAARKARQAASGEPPKPPKPRGRPRKKSV